MLFTISARSLNGVRDAQARGPVEVIALSQNNVRVASKINAWDAMGARKDVVAVPPRAIRRGPDGTSTSAAKPEGAVDLRPVIVGPAPRGQAVVATGISGQERGVAHGQCELRSGSGGAAGQPLFPAFAKRDHSS